VSAAFAALEPAGPAVSPGRLGRGEIEATPVPLAFDAFYRAEFRRVVAVARSLTGSAAVAEELAQEGFIAAHRRWARVATYDRPGDWVRRVVVNRAISAHRRKGAERRAMARMGRRDEAVPPLPDDDDWLWQQVRSLPPRQAQAIALVYVEDLPLERVATILGCAETTVKTHLKRGRDTLADRIRAREADDVPMAGAGPRPSGEEVPT
jgi:RNA polymerase sigma-70 factor (ECF subfamily)